jgi:hypothetical protein
MEPPSEEALMLFAIIGKAKAGSTANERIARRVNWQYPPGLEATAEYWLMTSDPTLVAIVEAENIGPIMKAFAEWDDLLDMTVVPTMTAEKGLELAEQM